MNVLMLSTTFIPSVLLCGHCQLDYLEKQGEISYRFVPSHFVKRKNVEWADVIVFGRSDTDIDAYVAKIAKKAGKHLVYFLDDDILNVPSYLSSAPYYLLPSTQKNIRKTMSYCDTFLTPSPVLKEKYGGSFKHSYLIAEPSLNRIDKKEKNGKIKIGFAGSIDRTHDLNEILEDAITRIVEKYGESIEIEIMGAKPDFIQKLGLKYLPYQDGYDAYTAFMARCNWDIGLAPMPLSDFHRCKYFNKYVEYASFGIAGIYTNCEPYVFGIRNGENGLLVENTEEAWFNAICELIENEPLRKRISDMCLKEADEIYSLRVLAPDYYQKMMNEYRKPDGYGRIPGFALAKASFFCKRVYRKIREQGKDFPEWLRKKLDKKYQEYKDKLRYKKNTSKLDGIIDSRKTVFVIAPYPQDSGDYEKRVRLLDGKLDDYYLIYLNGEDRSLENLNTVFIDDRHASIVFNSYDLSQTEKVISMIQKGNACLIHSVVRFIREKLSNEMYRVFDLKDTCTLWDTHGMIPEMYHKLANTHTEMVTSEIEKTFFEKADVIICENGEIKKHFMEKYGEDEQRYLICPSGDDKEELARRIKEKNSR